MNTNCIFIYQPDIHNELGDELTKSLAKKINSDPVEETWFDEVQNSLYKALLKVFTGYIQNILITNFPNIHFFMNIKA